MMAHPPSSPLFPYTTLFRSRRFELAVTAALVAVPAAGAVWLASSAPALTRQQASAHAAAADGHRDRESTRLNSSHITISYAVFCLKKKNKVAAEVQAEREVA